MNGGYSYRVRDNLWKVEWQFKYSTTTTTTNLIDSCRVAVLAVLFIVQYCTYNEPCLEIIQAKQQTVLFLELSSTITMFICYGKCTDEIQPKTSRFINMYSDK